MEHTHSASISSFQFDNSQIHIAEHNAAPWFVSADICKVLGYAQTTNGLKLCKQASILDELNKINQLAPATKWIPESDVYRLILRSTFPTIRQTGDYLGRGDTFQVPQEEQATAGSRRHDFEAPRT